MAGFDKPGAPLAHAPFEPFGAMPISKPAPSPLDHPAPDPLRDSSERELGAPLPDDDELSRALVANREARTTDAEAQGQTDPVAATRQAVEGQAAVFGRDKGHPINTEGYSVFSPMEALGAAIRPKVTDESGDELDDAQFGALVKGYVAARAADQQAHPLLNSPASMPVRGAVDNAAKLEQGALAVAGGVKTAAVDIPVSALAHAGVAALTGQGGLAARVLARGAIEEGQNPLDTLGKALLPFTTSRVEVGGKTYHVETVPGWLARVGGLAAAGLTTQALSGLYTGAPIDWLSGGATAVSPALDSAARSTIVPAVKALTAGQVDLGAPLAGKDARDADLNLDENRVSTLHVDPDSDAWAPRRVLGSVGDNTVRWLERVEKGRGFTQDLPAVARARGAQPGGLVDDAAKVAGGLADVLLPLDEPITRPLARAADVAKFSKRMREVGVPGRETATTADAFVQALGNSHVDIANEQTIPVAQALKSGTNPATLFPGGNAVVDMARKIAHDDGVNLDALLAPPEKPYTPDNAADYEPFAERAPVTPAPAREPEVPMEEWNPDLDTNPTPVSTPKPAKPAKPEPPPPVVDPSDYEPFFTPDRPTPPLVTPVASDIRPAAPESKLDQEAREIRESQQKPKKAVSPEVQAINDAIRESERTGKPVELPPAPATPAPAPVLPERKMTKAEARAAKNAKGFFGQRGDPGLRVRQPDGTVTPVPTLDAALKDAEKGGGVIEGAHGEPPGQALAALDPRTAVNPDELQQAPAENAVEKPEPATMAAGEPVPEPAPPVSQSSTSGPSAADRARAAGAPPERVENLEANANRKAALAASSPRYRDYIEMMRGVVKEPARYEMDALKLVQAHGDGALQGANFEEFRKQFKAEGGTENSAGTAAKSPQVRLAEPRVPDVKGEKYAVSNPRTGYRSPVTTLDAAHAMWKDRGPREPGSLFDRIVVEGSDRPVMEWGTKGGPGAAGFGEAKVYRFGASVEEARHLATKLPAEVSPARVEAIAEENARGAKQHAKDVAAWDKKRAAAEKPRPPAKDEKGYMVHDTPAIRAARVEAVGPRPEPPEARVAEPAKNQARIAASKAARDWEAHTTVRTSMGFDIPHSAYSLATEIWRRMGGYRPEAELADVVRDLTPEQARVAGYYHEAFKSLARQHFGDHELALLPGGVAVSPREVAPIMGKVQASLRAFGVELKHGAEGLHPDFKKVGDRVVEVPERMRNPMRAFAQKYGVALDINADGRISTQDWNALVGKAVQTEAGLGARSVHAMNQTPLAHRAMATALRDGVEKSRDLRVSHGQSRPSALSDVLGINRARLARPARLALDEVLKGLTGASSSLGSAMREAKLTIEGRLGKGNADPVAVMREVVGNDYQPVTRDELFAIDLMTHDGMAYPDGTPLDPARVSYTRRMLLEHTGAALRPEERVLLSGSGLDTQAAGCRMVAARRLGEVEKEGQRFFQAHALGVKGSALERVARLATGMRIPGLETRSVQAMDALVARVTATDPTVWRRMYADFFHDGRYPADLLRQISDQGLGGAALATPAQGLLNYVARLHSMKLLREGVEKLSADELVLPMMGADKKGDLVQCVLDKINNNVRYDSKGRNVIGYSPETNALANLFVERTGLSMDPHAQGAGGLVKEGGYAIPPAIHDQLQRSYRQGLVDTTDAAARGRVENAVHMAATFARHAQLFGVLFVPILPFHLNNFLQAPFQVAQQGGERGLAGVGSAWARNPKLAAELATRLGGFHWRSDFGSGVMVDRLGRMHDIGTLEDAANRVGLDTTFAKGERSHDLLHQLAPDHGFFAGVSRALKIGDEAMAELSHQAEMVWRAGVFIDHLRAGEDERAAGEAARNSLYDYSSLSAPERGMWKWVFPGWAFMRKNADAMFAAMLHNPERVARQLRFATQQRNWWGQTPQQQEDVSPEDFGRVILAHRDGAENLRSPGGVPDVGNWAGEVAMGPSLPALQGAYDLWSAVNVAAGLDPTLRNATGESPTDSLQHIAGQMNPAIKRAIEATTDKNPGSGATSNSFKANALPSFWMDNPFFSSIAGPLFSAKFIPLGPAQGPTDRTDTTERNGMVGYFAPGSPAGMALYNFIQTMGGREWAQAQRADRFLRAANGDNSALRQGQSTAGAGLELAGLDTQGVPTDLRAQRRAQSREAERVKADTERYVPK